jgi:hypothetical protein
MDVRTTQEHRRSGSRDSSHDGRTASEGPQTAAGEVKVVSITGQPVDVVLTQAVQAGDVVEHNGSRWRVSQRTWRGDGLTLELVQIANAADGEVVS